ncbi:hypothetical protein ABZZ20_11930 [Streptomyces sp. NPDC006430]|uniref:hypothetical protein n=1 Tax=Streptomyces sp. NPDC006430 TaxID=3154299 RepID=UPI0033B9ED73
MSGIPAPMRTVRAAMFAAVCTALGATGHAYMSDANVPPLGLLVAFGVTGGLAWLAAGRRRGPVGITTALLAVQGVLHLVFSGSQTGQAAHAVMPGHHPMTDVHGMQGMAGMHGTAGMAGMVGMPGTTGTGGMVEVAGHGGLGMIAAHVLAGLFCAAWLAWGEVAVFRLAAVLGAAALLAARPLARAVRLVRAHVSPVPAPPARRPSYEPPRALRGAVPAHALVRRGPPGWRDTRATAPGRPARA